MEKIITKSQNRPISNKGWVKMRDCFSKETLPSSVFNSFDTSILFREFKIKPNMGLVPHEHKNQDFLIVPLNGSLIQKNNLGQTYKLNKGDLHLMHSACGIKHFEYNDNPNESLECIVFEMNSKSNHSKPACETIKSTENGTGLQNVNLQIFENITLFNNNLNVYIGNLKKNSSITHTPKNANQGYIVFVIEGEVSVGEDVLKSRDTISIWKNKTLPIKSNKDAKIIIFETQLSAS